MVNRPVVQSPVWVSLGTSDAPAEPRPESEGFSMKKRWQLKAKAPSSHVARVNLPSGALGETVNPGSRGWRVVGRKRLRRQLVAPTT